MADGGECGGGGGSGWRSGWRGVDYVEICQEAQSIILRDVFKDFTNCHMFKLLFKLHILF